MINPHCNYWTQQAIDAAHKRGWLVTNNPDQTIYHELGHFEHRHNVGLERVESLEVKIADGPMKQRIEGEVSKYAATKRTEFVAEVYAGMKTGKTFGEKIMAYYKQLGGVVPK